MDRIGSLCAKARINPRGGRNEGCVGRLVAVEKERTVRPDGIVVYRTKAGGGWFSLECPRCGQAHGKLEDA